MDSSLRSYNAINDRIEKLLINLVQHFEDMISLVSVEETDYTSTARNAYQMDVLTASLIRNSQDILTLTRQMQETWLFGQLDTLGKSSVENRTDEDARAVAAMLEQLIKLQDASGS